MAANTFESAASLGVITQLQCWRAPFVAFAIVASTILPSRWASADDVRLVGSGASFPVPIYSAWFKDFGETNPGVTVDYQAKGSGAGIQDFIDNIVDFAGSGSAMTDAEIAKVANGVVLLPITAGEIVLAYNLPDSPKGLKLPREVYTDIFLGKITKWDDQRIVATNPNLKLPDLQITVVMRSDSSGATFVFTKHLSAISEAFAKQVGSGMTVQWPHSENMLAAPLSDGVAATIKEIPGAIGYIEYGYAKLTKMDSALLQNRTGNYVAAGDKSGVVTLATAVLDSYLRGWVDDPTAAGGYPIVTFTWLLAYKKQDPKKAEWLRRLVDYCVTTGQAISDSMGFIPLPENVVAKIKTASAQIQ